MANYSNMTADEKRKAFFKMNYVSLLCEGFLFTFALSIFSMDNILALYVREISENPYLIAIMSAVYLGVSYSATFFSCAIGANAKSPKWTSVVVCFFQRVGFFLILISTFFIENEVQALVMFYISLVLYSVSAGMATPLFTQMITFSIFKNVGSFFGYYNIAGNIGGVIATAAFTFFLGAYAFPLNYRFTFLAGLLVALLATLVVAVGVREVTDDRVVETQKVRLREILPICMQILRSNVEFRIYTVVRIILGAVEFATPYYIVFAGTLANQPENFLGIMTGVFLVSKIIGSFIMGKIADKAGVMNVLRVASVAGIISTALVIFMENYMVAYVMYAFLGFASNSIRTSNMIAGAEYSRNVRTPFYMAIIGILCAPISIITAFFGATIAEMFSYRTFFLSLIVIYVAAIFASFVAGKKHEQYKN